MNNYQEMLTRSLGNKLHYFQEVGSTNDVAKRMKAWEHGMVIVASNQTSGRGTYGRTFYSQAGHGIYMTLLIDTEIWHFKNETLATIFAAVATSEAVGKVTHIFPDIKWVNDLFINGKKIGGILTEKDYGTNKLIIGIGINLSGKQEEFPAEIRNTAASLELIHPTDNQAAAIVSAIYEQMLTPEKFLNPDIILNLYKEKLFIINEVVDIAYGNDHFEAKVIDVDDQGRLVVIRNEKQLRLNAGEVRIKVTK